MFWRNEMLPRRLEERRQHSLIDPPSSAELAVDHVHAPVKHRFGGNVRPLGSDPRCGTDHRPDENCWESCPDVHNPVISIGYGHARETTAPLVHKTSLHNVAPPVEFARWPPTAANC